ncbi:hypothetical protein, conserved [Babesia bigemina]|uniref:Uncharacterized protein n=1 Tax=Babesia bigemina TaxID=5866 RepID=A0A061D2S7_BABBI|nr:hypothetical protein, conserved [Babesia bigemina]CDR94908.1 hypothetical protein, conserved [Babesia bigemina]|eukprot:XP_012767094.1 hypothetical protein, conserved [Babesia bigemina]
MWHPSTSRGHGLYVVQLFNDLTFAHRRGVRLASVLCGRRFAFNIRSPVPSQSVSGTLNRVISRRKDVFTSSVHCDVDVCASENLPRHLQVLIKTTSAGPASQYRQECRRFSSTATKEYAAAGAADDLGYGNGGQNGAGNVTKESPSTVNAEGTTAAAIGSPAAPEQSAPESCRGKTAQHVDDTQSGVSSMVNKSGAAPKTRKASAKSSAVDAAPSSGKRAKSKATKQAATADAELKCESAVDNGAIEPSVAEAQALALDAAFELSDGESLDWNNKQLCKVSHRNFLLYAYNQLDMATVVKITNQVLAAYQTLPRRRKASQRRQYVQRFLRCIRKHKPLEDHRQLARWLLRCIDLLTCDDLYSMLRVRHILNYDNSFETFRASFGMENFESFSNVRTSKVQQDKLIGEKALKSRTAQRNLLMRHLKINKFRFLKDQNVTKAVYEANIDWVDAGVSAASLEPERFAFVYNLPFIEHGELTAALHEVLTRFSKVRRIDIFSDRLPPLTTLVKRSAVARNSAPPPRDKRMADALQFIANALVEQPVPASADPASTEHLVKQPSTEPTSAEGLGAMIGSTVVMGDDTVTGATVGARGGTEGIEAEHEAGSSSANAAAATTVPSQCRITPSSKRKHGASGQSPVVTADAHGAVAAGEWPACSQPALDNHVDSSMLEKLQNKSATSDSMDPQWVVLRFSDFKHAYFARLRLLQKFADEPRSLVSFDTKRSIFHNGKYLDLPLFQYSPRTENDPSVARISQGVVEDNVGLGAVGVEVS